MSNYGCLAAFCMILGGCSEAAGQTEATSTVREALSGSAAEGAVPAGLPARLQVGLFENTGSTWMSSSGVPWDMRYRYFTKGWVDNYGWNDYDGSWGLEYMRECAEQNYIPAIQYYQMHDEPGGGESAFLSKLQDVATMASYFGDFKLLMQRAKEFGQPVVVLMEADGSGLLQQQTDGDPNVYAAVQDAGLPELSELPNTVAGFGLAFLALRESVGAHNVVLGMHVSAWASGKDIAHFSVSEPLEPEVDEVYEFLAPFGLTSNVTGATYDLLVADPLDRDADYYRLVVGEDRWWDATDSAPISSKSFNRYAEWLRLWNLKAEKRWVLWQIPLGNSESKNVANNGKTGEGYKDNRAEYFFASGNGTEHVEKFADAGVIALLFGAGADGQSSYENDGQYLQTHAGAFLNAGGLAIDAKNDSALQEAPSLDGAAGSGH